MNKISKNTIIVSVLYICLWVIGSALLYHENNGKIIIAVTAAVVLFRISSQIKKDRKASSGR